MRADRYFASSGLYSVEPLSDARTPLEDFFSIRLGQSGHAHTMYHIKERRRRKPWNENISSEKHCREKGLQTRRAADCSAARQEYIDGTGLLDFSLELGGSAVGHIDIKLNLLGLTGEWMPGHHLVLTGRHILDLE